MRVFICNEPESGLRSGGPVATSRRDPVASATGDGGAAPPAGDEVLPPRLPRDLVPRPRLRGRLVRGARSKLMTLMSGWSALRWRCGGCGRGPELHLSASTEAV